MDSAELLRQAIHAARSGRELTARDLFQDVIRVDPNNEVAWMWLSGLLDPLEDRLTACERVLSINPENRKIRAYRDKLLKEYDVIRRQEFSDLDDQVQRVRWLLESNRRDEAILLLQNILREANGHKGAWTLFAELSVGIADKVRAYEAIVHSDPSDSSAQLALKRYHYYQRHPLELAAHFEEEGELDKALDLYQVLATEAGDSPEFERIYKNIVRLENSKLENIRHIKPGFTILRLSIGLPLLYLLEVLVQEGLNPFKHPAPHLWLGLPMVILGSFLLTVAGLRVRHTIWRRWFGAHNGMGSNIMRTIVTLIGWILVAVPHLLLVWDSYVRLQAFQIPAIPWIN